MFILLSVEVDLIPKKRGDKQNLVWPNGSYDGKVVFKLLAKVLPFQVRLTVVDIWGHGFEFVSRQSTLRSIKEYLNNFVLVFLVISISTKILRSRK